MKTRALEDTEIKSIFDTIEGINGIRNRCMIISGIGMALRASELVGLKIFDVYDGKNVRNYVTIRGETAKFGKEREIRLWDIVREELSFFIKWKKDNNQSLSKKAPLFLSREGGHLTRYALFYLIKKIFSKASVNQPPHCLRKTGATIFYTASDCDLLATQQFLGHANPSTTREYIGIPSQHVKEYSQRSSDWLKNAIFSGQFNRINDMLNSDLSNFSDSDLIVELQARGVDMTSALEHIKRQRKRKEKVIQFPMR